MNISKATGVNLVGYAKSEQGVGEACRLTANALAETDIDWKVIDWEMNNPSRQNDTTLSGKISETIDNNISIININADQLLFCEKHFPKDIWDTYRIGIWYWELGEFPSIWDSAFDLVNEIWAPTKFIQECLAKKAKCPVLYMPPGLRREEPSQEFNRAYFGLPENAFLFLNMFDLFSYSNRKNPEAAIKAFKKAFKPNDMSVGLVLKVNNLDAKKRLYHKIKSLIKGYRNIYIISKIMTRDEVNGLMCACNAVVSLHRSEGLGLLCQEAMYYGKPVIATGWSGNMDFMNTDNSCLVSYKMIPVYNYNGVSKKSGQYWAEPDVNEAAEYMKKLCTDQKFRERIALAGKETITGEFSPYVCGKRMEERIKQIWTQIAQKNVPDIHGMLFTEDYECMYRAANLNYWMPVECDGRFKNVRLIAKKIVRKFCSPILIPFIEQQNSFNLAALNIFSKQDSEIGILDKNSNWKEV